MAVSAALSRLQPCRQALFSATFARFLTPANSYPPPRTLCDFLVDNLRKEFELRYYVLDRAKFDVAFVERAGYVPLQIKPDNGHGGRDVLNSILLVDFLGAQRHLSDSSGGSRAEDLSRCLSRFYDRNLEQREDDYDAIRALAEAESMLNEHLTRVFEPTLRRLGDLGYPGMTNPRLLIRSALNPTTIMSSQDGAHVHYALGDPQDGTEGRTLPDRYNGLGFKNLIYMVVELLHLHAQWMDIEENRPPLHLVFIEEPEAHLHAQLQQVFIRKVLDILEIDGEDQAHYANQLVVTTHSPHVLYERGFRAIRYFRRAVTAKGQSSDVLNLSAFYAQTENPTRDFLERYLKLTHCDLFFADAAVLVEGNVERLLLPQMIGKVAPRLKSACLSVIEIGGAFGYRFRSLIEFLGITTLIVTDIDSVVGPPPVDDAAPAVAAEHGVVAPVHPDEPDEDQPEGTGVGTACMVSVIGAVSSNQTLVQWLPRKSTISDLLAATPEQRTQQRSDASKALIRVSYQMGSRTSWLGATTTLNGRTLEEAFALENLVWCQAAERSDLKLRVRGAAALTVAEIAEKLHKKIKSTAFKKTDFALALLAEPSEAWTVPSYIAQGLQWLQDEIAPLPPDGSPSVVEVVVP